MARGGAVTRKVGAVVWDILRVPVGIVAGMLAAVLGYTYAIQADLIPEVAGLAQQPSDERIAEDLTDSPEELIIKYGCWTGPAPKKYEGKMPGAVIWRGQVEAKHDWYMLPGMMSGQNRLMHDYIDDPQAVQVALEQVFGVKDHHLTVIAFCP